MTPRGTWRLVGVSHQGRLEVRPIQGIFGNSLQKPGQFLILCVIFSENIFLAYIFNSNAMLLWSPEIPRFGSPMVPVRRSTVPCTMVKPMCPHDSFHPDCTRDASQMDRRRSKTHMVYCDGDGLCTLHSPRQRHNMCSISIQFWSSNPSWIQPIKRSVSKFCVTPWPRAENRLLIRKSRDPKNVATTQKLNPDYHSIRTPIIQRASEMIEKRTQQCKRRTKDP